MSATKTLAGLELPRRSGLRDAALVHQHHQVRHGQRLGLVVRDVDECRADAAVDALDFELHLIAQLLVEGAERLVHQQQARMRNQRSRHRHPLLLAAGQLARIAPAVVLHSHQRQRFGDAPFDVGLRQPGAHLERKRDVVRDVRCGNSAYDWNTMPMSRWCGGTSATERSSNRMSPASGVRNPAIRLSVVVLPDPLGPSSETNEPAGTSSEMPSTAFTAPNALVRLRSRSCAPLALGVAAASLIGDAIPVRGPAGSVRNQSVSADNPLSLWKNQSAVPGMHGAKCYFRMSLPPQTATLRRTFRRANGKAMT